jgi:hypothetical protein
VPSESHLLTPDEAAVMARCSVRTVRRAYLTGALTAHRRRGSRAVLLAVADVLDWAQAERVEPPRRLPSLVAGEEPTKQAGSGHKRPAKQVRARAPKLGTAPRFDLSPGALAARRRQLAA